MKNIKQCLFLLCLLAVGSISLTAQTYAPAIQYGYDPAGNRFLRQVQSICISNCGSSRLANPNTPKPDTATVFEDKQFGKGIKLYPNPTAQTLYIEQAKSDLQNTPTLLELYDIQGRLLQKQTTTDSKTALDLSAQPSGMYILRLIQADNQISDWKIIKNE
jgi:Secretion system C-terminal sorting domain